MQQDFRRFSEISCLLLLLSGACSGQQYVISTLAGGAPRPATASATTTAIGEPDGIAIDGSGNTFFTSGNCVYKLDASGAFSRVAGNSRVGYGGDGGPAANAQLSRPAGLAFDARGNLLVADSGTSRIRRISPAGLITTIAGTGITGFMGDNGPAAAAQLGNPTGLVVDSTGNIFIADGNNNRVRRISTAGIITTVAGAGSAGFSGDGGPATNAQLSSPNGVAIDVLGNLLISDTGNNRIRQVSAKGVITTIAGTNAAGFSGDGGSAVSAQLAAPYAVNVDSTGSIYVTDTGNFRIRKISGGAISTVAGTGTAGLAGDGNPATGAQISGARGVAADSTGALWIADTTSYRVRKISPAGIITTVAGTEDGAFTGDGGQAALAQLYNPTQVAVDALGNVFIADTNNNRVRKIVGNGTISTIAGSGSYGFAGDGGPATGAATSSPTGLALDATGNFYFSDGNRIRRVATDGTISTFAGTGVAGFAGDGGAPSNTQLNSPSGLAVDSSGNVYVADTANNRIRKITQTGTVSTIAGNGVAGFSGDGGSPVAAQLNAPRGVAIDAAGNLYIADSGNARVRKVIPSGPITTVAGGGPAGDPGDGGLATAAPLGFPASVVVDRANDLFIVDTYTQRVRRVSPAGTITTIAGNGNPGYTGDGGPSTGAELNDPNGIAIDAAGNLYLADDDNDSVRVLKPVSQAVFVSAVIDAATETPVPSSPGKIVNIFGGGLGPAQGVIAAPVDGFFGTTLAGTVVLVNGIAAPLIYTSASQIIAVIPYGVSGSNASLTVAYQSQLSAGVPIPIADSSPGIFTVNQTGAGQAASINAIEGTFNDAATPVKIGEYISLFLTGEGQTAPAGVSGKLATLPLPAPNLRVTATVGGIPATVQYRGSVFGIIAGLMQVNLQIPSGVTPGGYVPVVVKVGDASTIDGAVWIAVTN